MSKELQVAEAVTETAVTTGLTRNQKVGIIVGASVLTAGAAYGIYRLVKFIRAKKAAKGESAPESHE